MRVTPGSSVNTTSKRARSTWARLAASHTVRRLEHGEVIALEAINALLARSSLCARTVASRRRSAFAEEKPRFETVNPLR
jgi:hypothetical protein